MPSGSGEKTNAASSKATAELARPARLGAGGRRGAERASGRRARSGAAGGSWCPSPRSGRRSGRCWRGSSSTPAAKSTRSQRSAHSSPRRAPVVIASQTNMPQSGSCHASPAMRGGLRGRRRLRVGHRRRGRLRLGDRVDADPAPPDRSGERAVQDVVDLPQRGLAEGLAPVRAATPVALVVGASSMLDMLAAAAARPAGAQARVERIHRFAVDAADRQRTQHRADVQPDQPLVAGPGRVLDLQDIEVAVEQLVDSCVGARIAPLVHLARAAACAPSRPARPPSARPARPLVGSAAAWSPGSTPAYTLTRSAPLGRTSIRPRARRRGRVAAVIRPG